MPNETEFDRAMREYQDWSQKQAAAMRNIYGQRTSDEVMRNQFYDPPGMVTRQPTGTCATCGRVLFDADARLCLTHKLPVPSFREVKP
jgi:hypothetical protein